MRRIFVDTFYWLAISNPSDQWRQSVLNNIQDIQGAQLITTDEVLTEFLAGMSGLGKFHRGLAVQVVRSILADENVMVVPQLILHSLLGWIYTRHAEIKATASQIVFR